MPKKNIYTVFILMMIMLLAACGDDETEKSGESGQVDSGIDDKYGIDANMDKEMEPFSFTDQDDETFALDDLEGKWWVADLVFTNCTTVCLPMTTNMSSLQDTLADEGIDAELVSFSVDPDNDTPEVLKDYAEEYDADESNWHFLTGYDFETMQDMSVDIFMQPLEEPPEGDDQVTHGTRFFLIDPEGNVIKNYDGQQSDNMDDIAEDLKTAQQADG
ncbi:MAG TPA: SCO family protein [Virgibacillus sp.]|nr:SCO family protein [Virgibacillus sp.]